MSSLTNLQRCVFRLLLISWTIWLILTVAYLPLILHLEEILHGFKEGHGLENLSDDARIMGEIVAILILSGLFVDSLALSGVYRKYKLIIEMLWPWIIFHSVIIPCLLVLSIAAVMLLKDEKRFFALFPLGLSLLYSSMLVMVVKLHRKSSKKKPLVMEELNKIALEPLAVKAVTAV